MGGVIMNTMSSAPAASAIPVLPNTEARHPAVTGLTSEEARVRLQTEGSNAMPDTTLHPLHRALHKFWAPVPWMLEAAVVLELGLGKFSEASIIAALLVFYAALGYFQDSRAQ